MSFIMYALWSKFVFLCCIWLSNGAGFYEGDPCNVQNETIQGSCTPIGNCSWALTRIHQHQHVDICSFVEKYPLVCCPPNKTFDIGTSLSASLSQSNSSVPNDLVKQNKTNSSAWSEQSNHCTVQNERIPGSCTPLGNCSWALARIQQNQHIDICSNIGKNPIVCCPPNGRFDFGVSLSQSNSSVPNNKNDSSAWSEQRCEEYHPREGLSLIVGVGGERSAAQEFPHMAILGYGSESNKKWRCGGSLISYQHILTAAHCVESINLGEVKYVRLGDLDIQNDTDEAEPQDFNVKSAITHPDFDHLTLKHDIAILVLDNPVRISDYVRPGCLFPGGVIKDYDEITATGWGVTKFAGQLSSHLIKLKLKVVNNTQCRFQYRASGSRGKIDEDLQVCAGSALAEKIIDTCEGDSGGPLQITSYKRRKHHIIFGVTSFGKACGITQSAGVYTRVSSYLPWIKSIVLNNF